MLQEQAVLSHPRDVLQINKYNYLQRSESKSSNGWPCSPTAVAGGKQIGTRREEQLGNFNCRGRTAQTLTLFYCARPANSPAQALTLRYRSSSWPLEISDRTRISVCCQCQ